MARSGPQTRPVRKYGLVGAPLVNTRYGDDQGGAVEYLGETIGLAVVVTLNE